MFQSTSKAMPTSKPGRGKPLPVLLAMLVFFVFAASSNVLGQVAPRSTDKVPTPKPVTPSRPTGHRPRPPRTPRPIGLGTPRGSASEESDKFLDLGDQFAEKSRWNAAEAAYQEAVRLWSGNSDAWVAMGYLYVDKGTLTDAYRVYNRLRALDSKLAEDLLTEIKRK